MLKRKALGMIKVNKDIIIKNSPIDKKFWDIYLKCCAAQKLNDVELVRVMRRTAFGYHLYFDPIDMTSTVVSFKIRFMTCEEEPIDVKYEEVQQPT